MREWRSWRLRLDGRGKGGGAARAGPLPLPFPGSLWQPVGRPRMGGLGAPGGWARPALPGERECWPSLMLGE